MNNEEQRIALFIDFENLAIGARDANYKKFDINLILERLLEKGKVLVKRAYADWSRYAEYKRKFHEAAIELIEVPQKSIGGKNSADIRLVVDAMDLASQKGHITCFVVASGDSDFSPLVSKLKENGKHLIGIGVKNSTSDLLIDNCDEFIFYEDLVRGQTAMPKIADVTDKQQECFALLVDSILALRRENKEIIWGSMVKQTMQRKKPAFSEDYYGFRTFSALLEDAERRGVVRLKKDQKSGTYLVTGFGEKESFGAREALRSAPAAALAPPPSPAHPHEKKGREPERPRAAAKPETIDEEKEPKGEEEPIAEGAVDATGEVAGGSKRRRRRRGGRGRGKGKEAADDDPGSESESPAPEDEKGEPGPRPETMLSSEEDNEDDEDELPYGDEWAGIPTEPAEISPPPDWGGARPDDPEDEEDPEDDEHWR
jgi:uncharacterized protein (TIGR00288 family)